MPRASNPAGQTLLMLPALLTVLALVGRMLPDTRSPRAEAACSPVALKRASASRSA